MNLYATFDIDSRMLVVKDQDSNKTQAWGSVGMTMYEGKLDYVLEKWGYHRIGGWNMLSDEIETAQVEALFEAV